MSFLGRLIMERTKTPKEIDREVMLEDWVSRQLKSIPQGRKLIDVGAGEQKYKKHCLHLDYVSQDFCQYEGAGNGEALQTGEWDTSKIDLVSDITEIPAEDCSFDAVLCTEVLEHVPDPIRAIEEMSRILKPGGIMMITAPFMSETHFAPYHFCTGFDKYFFSHHLERLGYKDIVIEPYGNVYTKLINSIDISLGSEMGAFDKLICLGAKHSLFKYALDNRLNKEIACYGYNVRAVKGINKNR